MKTCIILVVLTLLTLSNANLDNEYHALLTIKSQLMRLIADVNENTQHTITSDQLITKIDYKFGIVPNTRLTKQLTEWNVPKFVQHNFVATKYSVKYPLNNGFVPIYFVDTMSDNSMFMYIGAVKNNAQDVEVGYMYAMIMQQYANISMMTKSNNNDLYHELLLALMNSPQLKNIKSMPWNNPVSNNAMDMLKQDVENFVSNEQKIREDMATQAQKANAFTQQAIGRFSFFMSSAQAQIITAVTDNEGYINDLLNNVITVDPKKRKEAYDLLIMIQYAEQGKWIYNTFFYSSPSGSASYAMIGGYNNGDSVYWLVGTFSSKFAYQPDAVAYRECDRYLWVIKSCDTAYHYYPYGVTDFDMLTLYDMFLLSLIPQFKFIVGGTYLNHEYERNIMAMRQINQNLNMVRGGNDSAWSWLTDSVNAVVGAWKAVVDAFKTSKKVELVAILSGKGFSHFAESGVVKLMKKLRPQYVDLWMQRLMTDMLVPANKQAEFKEAVISSLWGESSVWLNHETSFAVNTGGDIVYDALYTHSNDDSTTDWVILDFKADFMLAPDLLEYRITRSYVGGIYVSEEIKFDERPRNIDLDDIKAIYEFFYIVSFRTLGMFLGLKIDFPPL